MNFKKTMLGLMLTSSLLLGLQASFAGGEPEPELKVEESAVVSPAELVKSTPKGELKNPYTDNEEAITAGKSLYFSNSCNGCHGGSAGGGMCPPISNEVFVYGSDDDTVFRLVTLGSDELQKAGYFRKGMEGVVGPMPPFGIALDEDSDPIITDADDLWKIIAWLRTQYKGDPKRRDW